VRWLELSVTVDVEAIEAVSEILGRVADGTAVHPIALLRDPNDELAARDDPAAGYVVTAHVSDGPAAAGQVEAVERALWHLQAFGLRPVGALRVRSVDDAGWADAWREHYVAQRVGRVVIAPSWAEEPLGDGEVQVVLDPGMAFGTGLHPTTRACIAFLGDLDPMPPAVLDVGCGSGILALAALRLGVARAVGLDTDPVAVEATRANAERNGLAGRLEARQGTLPETPDDRYPLITANLVAAILVELAPRLAAHLAPGGVLFAAGIIVPRAEEVAAAMKAAGLLAIDRIDDGEWVSLRLGHVA
jgi:ribosomal protein L11 methyltransferase